MANARTASKRRTKMSSHRRTNAVQWARKNIVIDQYKLDRAKEILNVDTETAAVDAALDLVAFRGEVLAGLDRLVAAGGIKNRFDEPSWLTSGFTIHGRMIMKGRSASGSDPDVASLRVASTPSG